MLGTVLNVAGILIGGGVGLVRRRPLSVAQDSFCKVSLAAFTVYYGLRLTWQSLSGSPLHMLRQLGITVLALMLGSLTGRLLRFQRMSNRLGREAKQKLEAAQHRTERRASETFQACTILFCAAPLGIVGALEEGLTSSYYYPLVVKGVMEGLVTMGFAGLLSWGALLAALPVLAFQGSITLLSSQWLRPFLEAHQLTDSVNATGGLLIFSTALVMLGLKKIALADYLPSLVFAPLLTWIWR
ncbi:conserved membrane hypothetical protein [Verrucomicrobia bacterium]|nr:conserved membrane hypothetical protein [Verrucomicrobiota bacterium]